MNIQSIVMEELCNNLTNDFSQYFDWNDMGINYSRINLSEKSVNVLSSDYDWLLTFWGDDMDLRIGERLSAGMQYWSNYSNEYRAVLRKGKNSQFKVDFCTKHGDLFEIVSINSGKKLSVADMMTIYKWKPVISDYADRLWQKKEELILPLRAEINTSANESDRINNDSADILDIHQYMRFGNIRFTRKEILTIRLLLSHRKVKEISAVQGCSEASEHKRIQRIKEKLGCPHASSGGVFNALKENGITLACLDTLVSLP